MRMAKLNEIVDKWVKKTINFSQASWYGKHGEYIFLCAFKFCMAYAQSFVFPQNRAQYRNFDFMWHEITILSFVDKTANSCVLYYVPGGWKLIYVWLNINFPTYIEML